MIGEPLMVRVRLDDGATVVGLLIDTQLVTTSGPPAVAMNPRGELVQGPGQKGLQGFGVVRLDAGFLVGPLSSMQPILDPEEGDGEGQAAEEIPA